MIRGQPFCAQGKLFPYILTNWRLLAISIPSSPVPNNKMVDGSGTGLPPSTISLPHRMSQWYPMEAGVAQRREGEGQRSIVIAICGRTSKQGYGSARVDRCTVAAPPGSDLSDNTITLKGH